MKQILDHWITVSFFVLIVLMMIKAQFDTIRDRKESKNFIEKNTKMFVDREGKLYEVLFGQVIQYIGEEKMF